jgi:hypothetical protein
MVRPADAAAAMPVEVELVEAWESALTKFDALPALFKQGGRAVNVGKGKYRTYTRGMISHRQRGRDTPIMIQDPSGVGGIEHHSTSKTTSEQEFQWTGRGWKSFSGVGALAPLDKHWYALNVKE